MVILKTSPPLDSVTPLASDARACQGSTRGWLAVRAAPAGMVLGYDFNILMFNMVLELGKVGVAVASTILSTRKSSEIT